jgi:hypothetical protein
MSVNLHRFCLQRGARSSTIQLGESLLRDVVVTGFGTVDNGNRNCLVSLQVCQVPARAAGLGARFDVVSAADIWEVGEILEMRIFFVETVGASNFLGVAVFVAVLVRPRDIVEDNGEDVLAVGIRGVITVCQLLGRGEIVACGCSTSNVREDECEDDCSEVDHCEVRKRCRNRISLGWRGAESDENPKGRYAHASYT